MLRKLFKKRRPVAIDSATAPALPRLTALRSDKAVSPEKVIGQKNAPPSVGNATRVLTAPGGPVTVSDEQRGYCVVLADGTFLLHTQRLGDHEFQHAIRQAAQAAKVTLKPAEPVGFDEIRRHYQSDEDGDTMGQGMRGRAYNLLARAAANRVSDIQIIPSADVATVQFQVQGYLTEPDAADEIHLDELERLYAAVHNMSQHGDPIRRRNVDQRVTITNRDLLPPSVVGVRVQWVPAGPHQHMNARLLYEKLPTADPRIESLGMPEEIENQLLYILSRSSGMLTIAGPTESGKSFTQTCMLLSIIERQGRRVLIVSLADPPEGVYPGIIPYQINTDEEFDGISIVDRLTRATLRVSPHYVNFAEIRSEVMAREAFKASSQGKFITASTHTENALWIPYRYTKLGVDFHDAYSHSSHAALLSQRLVPHLCPHCRIEASVAARASKHAAAFLAEYRRQIGSLADATYVRGPGCEHCKPAGKITIPGLGARKLYMEMVRPDPKLFTLLRSDRENGEKDTTSSRRYWLENGARSMRLYALQDLLDGRIGLEEFTGFFEDVANLREDMELHPDFRQMLDGSLLRGAA